MNISLGKVLIQRGVQVCSRAATQPGAIVQPIGIVQVPIKLPLQQITRIRKYGRTGVQVYVGGTLQTSGYTVDSVAPATITFDTAPTEGYQVAIQVRQGLSWYHPGIGTASDGVPLQLTDTLAAQFFRGQ
jgi:hypothetical protein